MGSGEVELGCWCEHRAALQDQQEHDAGQGHHADDPLLLRPRHALSLSPRSPPRLRVCEEKGLIVVAREVGQLFLLLCVVCDVVCDMCVALRWQNCGGMH